MREIGPARTPEFAMPLSTRRLVRWAAVLASITFAVVACWHDTAYAHGTVLLTLHTDGRGSVWADVAWQDGHPVSEPITGVITARSDSGEAVGPVAMVGTVGEPRVRYAGTLPPGRWQVTADAHTPGTGTCTAEFAVGPTEREQSIRCGTPVPTAAPIRAAREEPASRAPWILLGVVVVAVLAGGAARLLLKR